MNMFGANNGTRNEPIMPPLEKATRFSYLRIGDFHTSDQGLSPIRLYVENINKKYVKKSSKTALIEYWQGTQNKQTELETDRKLYSTQTTLEEPTMHCSKMTLKYQRKTFQINGNY